MSPSPLTQTPPPPDPSPWRAQYLHERTKVRALAAASVLLGLTLIGSLVYTMTLPSAAPAASGGPGAQPGATATPGPRATGGAEGGTGRGARAPVSERYFTTDGALNDAEVTRTKEQFVARPTSKDRIQEGVTDAVGSGDITQAQADQLLTALGIEQ